MQDTDDDHSVIRIPVKYHMQSDRVGAEALTDFITRGAQARRIAKPRKDGLQLVQILPFP